MTNKKQLQPKAPTQASGKASESVPKPRIPRGSTTVAKETKVPVKAVKEASTKATAKPTIASLKVELADMTAAFEDRYKVASELSQEVLKLKKEVEDWRLVFNTEVKFSNEVVNDLDYELNKSWWTITKERFIQSIIRLWA